jgi:hypothetical protein
MTENNGDTADAAPQLQGCSPESALKEMARSTLVLVIHR